MIENTPVARTCGDWPPPMELRSRIHPDSRVRNLPLPHPNPYAIALLLVAVAFVILLLLWSFLQSRLLFLFLALAVLLAASYGGKGPGLVALAIGALAGWYFFLEPRYWARISDPLQRSQLVSFLLLGL